MKKLHRIMPWQLEADEVEWYHKALDTDDHSGGPDIVGNLILDGEMQLWVWSEDDSVLVTITRFIDSYDGYRELLVQMMAGENITSTDTHKEIHAELMSFALSNGCSRMIALMKPEIYEHMKGPLGPEYKLEYVQLALYPESVE